MLCGLGGCSVGGKQWGWVHMVIGQYRWWVGGCGHGGCSKSLLFLYAKKNDPFGGEKTTTTIQDIKEGTSNPFYPL